MVIGKEKSSQLSAWEKIGLASDQAQLHVNYRDRQTERLQRDIHKGEEIDRQRYTPKKYELKYLPFS